MCDDGLSVSHTGNYWNDSKYVNVRSGDLDVMYEPPRDIKQALSNKWVWELKERKEFAHDAVR